MTKSSNIGPRTSREGFGVQNRKPPIFTAHAMNVSISASASKEKVTHEIENGDSTPLDSKSLAVEAIERGVSITKKAGTVITVNNYFPRVLFITSEQEILIYGLSKLFNGAVWTRATYEIIRILTPDQLFETPGVIKGLISSYTAFQYQTDNSSILLLEAIGDTPTLKSIEVFFDPTGLTNYRVELGNTETPIEKETASEVTEQKDQTLSSQPLISQSAKAEALWKTAQLLVTSPSPETEKKLAAIQEARKTILKNEEVIAQRVEDNNDLLTSIISTLKELL